MDTDRNRAVPNSVEAEEAVLGSVLIDPEFVFRVVPFLRKDDFYTVKNGWVWDALVTLHRQNSPIDFLTVCNELETRGQLAEIGGASYVSHLINAVPTAIHAEGYGRIVKDKATRRSKIDAASRIAQLAYDETITPLELEAQCLQAVMQETHNSATLFPVSDISSGLLDTISEWANHPLKPGQVRGLSVGFRAIDNAMGGMDDDTLNVIAARPGMGKSALCFQITEHVAMQGKTVIVFSLEMSRQKVLARLACGRAKVNWQNVKRGTDDGDELTKMFHHLGDIGDLPIVVCDTPNLSIAQIRASVLSIHSQRPVSLIVVDHMGLVNEKANNDYQKMGIVSWGLKQIAKDFRIPVLSACQLSRGVESRKEKQPELGDLRDSGRIEENADTVIMIYREKYYNPYSLNHVAEIYVRKNRDGEHNARADLVFLDEFTHFENLQRTE